MLNLTKFIHKGVKINDIENLQKEKVNRELDRYMSNIEYVYDKNIFEKLKESSVENEYLTFYNLLMGKYAKPKAKLCIRNLKKDNIIGEIHEVVSFINLICNKTLAKCIEPKYKEYFPKTSYSSSIFPSLIYHLIYLLELYGKDFSKMCLEEKYFNNKRSVFSIIIDLINELIFLDCKASSGEYSSKLKSKCNYNNMHKLLHDVQTMILEWKLSYQNILLFDSVVNSSDIKRIFCIFLQSAVEHRDIMLLVTVFHWYGSIYDLSVLLKTAETNKDDYSEKELTHYILQYANLQKDIYEKMYSRFCYLSSLDNDSSYKDSFFFSKSDLSEFEKAYIKDVVKIESDMFIMPYKKQESYVNNLGTLVREIIHENQDSTVISSERISEELTRIKTRIKNELDLYVLLDRTDSEISHSIYEILHTAFVSSVECCNITCLMTYKNILFCHISIRLYNCIPTYFIEIETKDTRNQSSSSCDGVSYWLE